MTKGTYAKGQKVHKGRLHIRCRRCGKPAYHKIDQICASCGYGRSQKIRQYAWMKKKTGKHIYKIK